MSEKTKFDKVGCLITHFGKMIEDIDQFADENGDIRIKTVEEAIQVIAFLFFRVKAGYEQCLDRQLDFDTNTAGGAILSVLINLLKSVSIGPDTDSDTNTDISNGTVVK